MYEVAREQSLIDAYGVDDGRARAAEFDEVWRAGDAEAERLTHMAPGPELAAALVAARGRLMSPRGQNLLYGSWERQKAWTDAQAMVPLLAAVDMTDGESWRWMVADIALNANLSERTIGNRLAQASHFDRGLPQTWEAQNAGRITTTHAWVMAAVTRNVRPDLAQQVEDRVLEKAIEKQWTPAELGEAARKAVIDVDPEGAAERAAEAKKQSDVRLSALEDEMARMTADSDAWTGRQMMDELNRRADEKRRAGDERSLGQLRAGALAEALLGDDVTKDEPADGDRAADETDDGVSIPRSKRGATPKRATALLLVSLPTLLGGCGSAYLEGFGPITAVLARRIAADDVTFRRLVFDQMSGKPVDVGDNSYELPAEMRRWLDVRDRTCLFPHCRRRAVFCDADHAVEWPEGKTTCENCGLLCRKHHNFKTEKAWKLRRNPDDSVDWESPYGFRWHRPASSYEEFLNQPEPEEPPDWLEVIGNDLGPPPDAEPLPEPPEPETDDDRWYDEVNRLWSHAFDSSYTS